MSVTAFNRVRERARVETARKKQYEEVASETDAEIEQEDKFVAECEAEGIDPQLADMTETELKAYAEEHFSVKLDLGKPHKELVLEVMALEDEAEALDEADEEICMEDFDDEDFENDEDVKLDTVDGLDELKAGFES